MQISDFPFCPHGRGTLEAVEDSIPGGFVQENFGNAPETFYSKKAMLQRADELNLRLRDQWAGPGDRYLSNWSAVSPKTLEDAKALLERVGQATGRARATLETVQFTQGPWRES
jgi:hypothetical protein